MLSLKTPVEVACELAQRIRLRRLHRGWTQFEIARRAGVRPATYVVFERHGRISLLRLLKVLDVLELLEEVDRVGRKEDLKNLTLNDLTKPDRKRGRRSSI